MLCVLISYLRGRTYGFLKSTTDFSETFMAIFFYVIGHYNPSVRFTIWFLTPLMLCVLIYNIFFRNIFMAIFLLSLYVSEDCREAVSKGIFFYISFCFRCQTWDLNHDLKSNKPTHYLLNYVDY